ncbi:MAG: type I pullulanase, partial [Ruminococcus flavefaciens]|nr:type I pullulanase [Ruminococcus flavefaciens]
MRAKKLFLSLLAFVISFAFVFGACTPTPAEEYELPLEDGCNQLTIYYNRPSGYDNCDIWLWYGEVAGRGYTFHECAYGAKVVVNVPEAITEVGFIIRTGCSDPGGTSWGEASKDGTDSDRSVSIRGRETVIYTKSGDAKSYISEDGGVTLKEMKFIEIADMVDTTHIKIVLSTKLKATKDDVTVLDAQGNEIQIADISSNNSVNVKVETASPLDLAKQYSVKVAGFDGEATVIPSTYFSSKAFEDEYAYDGELGVILSANQTEFRLWAPTASAVKLNLFQNGNGGSAIKTVDLQKGEKGVWSHTESENLNGKYYTYTVSTSAGTQEAVDPYAVSAGLNGLRGMILDLDSTDPAGWTNTPYDPAGVENYTDAQIWEVHVRDFSNKIESSQYKGKFLAFTETGLTNSAGKPVGVDYLKNLGITHVHLLPSFDYASVDESKTGANAQFNWGYDPKNYNVPEGSYSTDPTDGAKRVNEYKQMVQALHGQGIGVIMDVVYNHTYDLGSNFNKIVPYYYYRFTSAGAPSNGSGCGNETASERAMFRKFMVDSVKYWQSEYNVDGFRFDLMGLHDITTMQEIETAVHSVNPKALIYGEGWTGGSTTLSGNEQSVLSNLRKLNAAVGGEEGNHTNGIAMFNDALRDAVKGSVFDIDEVGFATGANSDSVGKILFGVNGSVGDSSLGTALTSWQAYNPTNVINYVSAHDNNTLWDRICHVYGEEASTLELRLARNRLSAAIVQTSLGIPFMQAGEEMLRQKKNADGSYNENSYNSSDAVNNIQWDLLTANSEQTATSDYYKGLIAFRKATPTLRLPVSVAGEGDGAVKVVKLVKKEGALIAFTMTNPYTDEQLFVVYNAKPTAQSVALPEGNWDLYVTGSQAGTTAVESGLSGSVEVTRVSCYV